MKAKIAKYISFVVVGFVSFVLSLVKYIMSFEKYSDEWGTDISFNEDYIVAIMISLIILGYAIYCLVVSIKNQEIAETTGTFIGAIISCLIAFYPLGVLFKALNKEKPFMDYLNYLFVGLFGIALLVYFIFSYLEKRKVNKTIK